MKLKPGFKAEYKRRHDEIWPELSALLKEAGISNYTIFLDEETNILFAVQTLSGDNSSQDLSQNEIVKRLASWAAILAVPTLIASIYGMNFDLMPELHWPASYFIVLLIMISISSFLFYRLRQIDWL